MGVTKVLKVLSGGGAENEPDIEWYYVAPPRDLHLHVLSLYCTVTFFDDCVWRITSKLRGDAKPTISEQSDSASSLEFSCESLDWSFESFASLHHRSRLVESWRERTKLRKRANSLSFPPRPLLASCFRHVSCNRTGEVFSYAAIQTMFMLAEVHLALPLADNVFTFKRNYYSFKIFPQFWLAKSTPIIHNNQLPMTKFGRILCLTGKWRQKCSPLQVNAPLTEKTWGRGWVVLVVKTKIGRHFTRFKSKNYSWN